MVNENIRSAEENLLHIYNRFPVALDHGEGVYLYDTEGKQYLDFAAGIGVTGLGYHNKELDDALKAQIDRLCHISNLYYHENCGKAAKALAAASGTAAITYVIQALAQAGEHIVAQKTIYGGSYNLLAHTLPQYGIQASFVDVHDLNAVTAAIQPNTKAIYLETLGNPNSDIPDIDAIAKIAHAHGLPLVIDNTFGTPYLIRPIEHGADIVVHSATKFIGGHGTTLGGIIVDSGKFDWKASGKHAPIAAPNPSLWMLPAPPPLSLTSALSFCGTPGQRFPPSMPFCCSREWRPCPFGWSDTPKTQKRW